MKAEATPGGKIIKLSDHARKPWDGNEAMRLVLEHTGLRYAQLIGITNIVPEGIPEAVAAADRARYGHFIHRTAPDAPNPNLPIWKAEEAVTFVHEITGYDRDVCREWLEFDWL